jgi:RNA polymerase sigma-70 factor (ECF subfamily)
MIAELVKIAGQCDGVRCDMAMLLLPDVFERTWCARAPLFWPKATERVRQAVPGFCIMAEVYWDLEWTLQQQGFDYTYDKRLYDRLREVPIVRALLDRPVRRLHQLCATLLYRSYPRLTRPPLNLQADEKLSAVVERLLKALREARPASVRQFFALACQHMRWELNDLARRLDQQPAAVELNEGILPTPASTGSGLTPDGHRMLAAIDSLPEEEREAFDLVRIQGMTQAEAAQVLGVSAITVKRRLSRGLQLLAATLGDLSPGA